MLRLSLAFAVAALATVPALATPAAKPTPKPAAGTVIPAPNGKGCINSVTKKFAKCPPAAPAVAVVGVTKDKDGKCHVASGPKKGKFTPCPK